MSSPTTPPAVRRRPTHPLRRTAALAVSAVTAVAVTVPSPAVAAALSITEATDRRGDVRITSATGLGETARKTIDLRSFRVAARDDGKVRFTVGIKRIVRKERFDQMFFVTMLPPKRSGQRWYAQVGFTSKGPMSFATFSGERGGSSTSCDIGRVIRAPKHAKVGIDVPRRCLPSRVARLRVETYTGFFLHHRQPWSRDGLRVPGRHDVTPPRR